MINGEAIMKRQVGDRNINISFRPDIDCSGQRLSAYAISASGNYRALRGFRGAKKGVLINAVAFFGGMIPGKYRYEIRDESEQVVASTGLVYYNEDGFTIGPSVVVRNVWVDHTGKRIIDHRGIKILATE